MDIAENKFKTNYYAQALFNISSAQNTVDIVEEELRQLKDAILQNIDLKKFLTDPSIDKSEKIKALFSIFDSQASSTIFAFISMIVILDAVELIEQIYNDYVLIINQYKKQLSVEVISAVSLGKDTLGQIKKEVDQKAGLDVRIKNIIDKSIIGGIIIKIGDRIIDLSLKYKIEDLRNKLKSIELRGEEFGIEN